VATKQILGKHRVGTRILAPAMAPAVAMGEAPGAAAPKVKGNRCEQATKPSAQRSLVARAGITHTNMIFHANVGKEHFQVRDGTGRQRRLINPIIIIGMHGRLQCDIGLQFPEVQVCRHGSALPFTCRQDGGE